MNSRRIAALFILALLTLAASRPAQAQQNPPAAPIPPAILSAKTAFISKASGASFQHSVADDLAYNEFYAALQNLGRYQLVSSPGEADLVIEIRFDYLGSLGGFHVSANILDLKTRTILWAFDQPIYGATRKNFDKSMAALIADFKTRTATANQP